IDLAMDALRTFNTVFGPEATANLNEMAKGFDAVGAAVRGEGLFSAETIAALNQLPGLMSSVGSAAVGMGAGLLVLKVAATGWQDWDAMAAGLETFNAAFGPEATANLMAAAGHISALAEGVKALVTAGDVQPLAMALG